MDRPVQYAMTVDGKRIAFTTMGHGPPLVGVVPAPVLAMADLPEARPFNERLARCRRLVLFDWRGTGLSDRGADDVSAGALVRDLEAVVDKLGLERVALFGGAGAGSIAIDYAARHPERVSHLVLWCSYARWPRELDSHLDALAQLAEVDWTLHTETLAHALVGWSHGDAARRVATAAREGLTADVQVAFLRAATAIDVTALLPAIVAPTLVLHRRGVARADLAQDLAAGIPDARLVLLDGDSPLPALGDMASVVREVERFLGDPDTPLDAVPDGAPLAILVTDVEASTALMHRLGDAAGRGVLRRHERIVRDAVRAHGGREIKSMGDGFILAFPSVASALACAVAIQRASAAAAGTDPATALRLRMGVNAGEPIPEDGDLFGTAVIVASRIAALAKGGEILVADVVRHLAAGKDFVFADRGETALKGFDEPARLHELRWLAPLAPA